MGRRKLKPEEKKPKYIRKTERVYSHGYEGYMKYYNERYMNIVARGIDIAYEPMTEPQFQYAYNAKRQQYKEQGKKAGNVIRDVVYKQTNIISKKQAIAIRQMYQGILDINPNMNLPATAPSVPDIMAGALSQDLTFRDLMRQEYLKKLSNGGDKKSTWNELLVELHYGGNSLYVK